MISSPVTDPTPISTAYARTAAPAICAPRLQHQVQSDVAIVGAGFTGLSTALHLAQQGVSVAIVEAKEVGSGGSGRAFGQVVPYAKHYEDHIYSSFGRDYGERLINLLASGPDIVYGLIEKHRMQCDPVRTGLLFAAHTKSAAGRLEARARFWQARSQPVALLEADELERVIGGSYYPCALIDYRGGCVNPLGYARGLAKAALEAGAQIFEHSRVTKVHRRANKWHVNSDDGELVCNVIVLATDAYTDNLWPGLRQSIVPVRAYHLMSAPLSENLRRSILPGGQSLTDSRRLYSGIRVRPDGRLHMSVDGPPFSNGGLAFAERATQRVQNMFPQVGSVEWEEQISGWVAISNDQYPHVHKLDPAVFAAVGFSGRGIAYGTLLGQELARRVLGKPEADCAVPFSPLRRLPTSTLTRMIAYGLINLYRFQDRRELKAGYVGRITKDT